MEVPNVYPPRPSSTDRSFIGKIKRIIFQDKDTGEYICPICAEKDWFVKQYAWDPRGKRPVFLMLCNTRGCSFRTERGTSLTKVYKIKSIEVVS